jgi:hypothetical protein
MEPGYRGIQSPESTFPASCGYRQSVKMTDKSENKLADPEETAKCIREVLAKKCEGFGLAKISLPRIVIDQLCKYSIPQTHLYLLIL